MITASTEDLLAYLADVIEVVERYGATVLPPNDGEEVQWARVGDDLVMDIEARLPASHRSADADLDLQERWSPRAPAQWILVEYGYDLRDRELGYRRALHRHDADQFVRAWDVATHEHCETTLGYAVCGHYAGEPAADAIDGFLRLYGEWLANAKPDCSELRCLG
jgi:hypothetical protein